MRTEWGDLPPSFTVALIAPDVESADQIVRYLNTPLA